MNQVNGNREFMDPIGNTGEAKDTNTLPKWLENVRLENALRKTCGDFKSITNVHVKEYCQLKDNASTLMLNFNIDYESKDGASKNVNFILKTQKNTNEAIARALGVLKLFEKEQEMYNKIIPKLEKLYEEAGKRVNMAPNAYSFDRDLGFDYVLLEDLRLRDFKNGNSSSGFDMHHMESVLSKLAEFHAASACYVEHFGLFSEDFTVGIYNRRNLELLKELNKSNDFLNELRKWKDCQIYYDKLKDCDQYLVERLLKDNKNSPPEFLVLNHGDCWMNNIMFQYDAFGKIKNVFLLDFQVCKYGSPANDLYYLILSSAAMDIKLSKFEYFVHFYYDKLVENLKVLQYHRPLPKLKNLHIALLKNGLTAFLVVSKVLPLAMLDSTDVFKSTELQDEKILNSIMYGNRKYVQAMKEILPWMDNRGLLDWK